MWSRKEIGDAKCFALRHPPAETAGRPTGSGTADPREIYHSHVKDVLAITHNNTRPAVQWWPVMSTAKRGTARAMRAALAPQFGGWNDIVCRSLSSSSTGEFTPTVNAFAESPPAVWRPRVAPPPRMLLHPEKPEYETLMS
jgi:hypothetical protein